MAKETLDNKRAAGRSNMKLTERDVWLFLFLVDTRFLTREHIERLFFTNTSGPTPTTKAKANRRLAKLVKNSFLERIYRPVTIGKAQAVYCLGKNAFPVLKKVLGTERTDLVYKKRASKVEFLFLDHTLGIAEFRVQLELALRANSEMKLLFWQREGQELNDRIPDPTGRQKYLPVTPDAFFGLKTPAGKSYFFLEVDMGTESLKRFTQKIIAYKQYWKSGAYTERYGYRHFRVLTVCQGERRLANLIQAAGMAGGKRMFLFSTVSLVETETPLSAVWLPPVNDDCQNILSTGT